MTVHLDKSVGDVPAAAQAFVAAVRDRLGADHAALFAMPVAQGDGVAWTSEGQKSLNFFEFDASTQDALLLQAGSILADIRHVAESENGAIRQYFPGMHWIPSLNCLFGVDGRAVVTRWGRAGGVDLLTGFGDRKLKPVEAVFPPLPPRLLRSALGGVGVGLLVATVWVSLLPVPLMCKGVPPLGHTHVADTVRPTAVVPPLADDLPAAKWQSHDLSMLKGCWHRLTNMVAVNVETHVPQSVALWTFCFDDQGDGGQQSLQYADNSICKGRFSSHFEGDTLIIEADRCLSISSGQNFLATTYRCTRLDQEKASCLGYTNDPRYSNHDKPAEGLFQRSALSTL
ncbi:hypothetical protein PY793_13345 [Acetobacter fabarum]|uniref:hypothetical protein n=1 Tax=Acetobacter fabarum TaxID=483199 RepID=UPI00312B6526